MSIASEGLDESQLRHIREKIEGIYQRHDPSKLGDVDRLMTKYAGREPELLKQIRNKYLPNPKYLPWQHALKNFNKEDREHNQNDEESIEEIRTALDALASSVFGECIFVTRKNGQRRLVVRQDQSSGGNSCDEGKIEAAVVQMRNIIHKRYEYKGNRGHRSTAPLQSSEHERRKAEKDADTSRKKSRDRRKRR